MTRRRGFDDLKVGEVYRSPSRTVTEAHFAAFQVISGDNHPIHYDIEFCARMGIAASWRTASRCSPRARSAPGCSRT